MMMKNLSKEIDQRELISEVVVDVLSRLGFLATKQSNPRVYRSDIVRMIGRRSFEKAVEQGKLHPVKEDLSRKTAKIWVDRKEWDHFKKTYANRAA
ncbi:MAG: hypothetical protein PHT77_01530 [Bacteroidales bacterium]|nr:hypothetical protein [Bacteroidales bacterium]